MSAAVDEKIIGLLSDIDCHWNAKSIRAMVFGAVCARDLISPASIIQEILRLGCD
jgi:hypothetical protein